MKSKLLVFICLLLANLDLLPLSSSKQLAANTITIQRVDVVFGQRRPFNWYYHDPFDYYYPRKKLYWGRCYWVYTYAGYVYVCD